MNGSQEPLHPDERAGAMARRLRRSALAAGLGEAAATRIHEAFAHVIRKRLAAFPEPHPDFLHPARTALILLEDAGVRDPFAICAGILYDSERPDLSTSPQEARTSGWHDEADLLESLPARTADDAELLEQLVMMDPPALSVALAERLDHARHLHFRPVAEWQPFHQQILSVYLPLAHRSRILSARLDRWAEAFARRLARTWPAEESRENPSPPDHARRDDRG